MTMLVSVDPGTRYAGVCLFRDGLLEAAALLRGETGLETAKAVAEWLGKIGAARPAVLLTEGQQIYAGRNINPNVILPLTFTCGAIHGCCAAEQHLTVKPSVWKGTIPKDVFLARIKAALKPSEAVVIERLGLSQSKVGHVLDAAGLGLWYFERLGQAGRRGEADPA